MQKALQKAKETLETVPFDSLLVTDPIDLYYLLSIELSLGILWLTKERAILFVDGRYQEVALALGCVEVRPMTDWESFLTNLKGSCAFDKDFVTYGTFHSWRKKKEDLTPIFSPIKELREVKEVDEIAKIKSAAELCMQGMQKVLDCLSVGISERELAHKLDLYWKKEGGDRFSFEPIIAFGANSSKPHYRTSANSYLKRGDIVLIDIGVVLDHYHSDMTRVFAFGSVPKKLEEIYKVVYQAKEAAKAGIKAGKGLAEIDALARDWITQKGYGEQFVHNLGHGIGLQTHEAPFLRRVGEGQLREKSIVTIEPGIYIPEVGGVRLEDMVLVEKESGLNLTPQFDSSEIITL